MTSQTIAEPPCLGPKSQAMLAGAGIESVAQVKRPASVHAHAKVRAPSANVSLNLLRALEGTLSGLPWQDVEGTSQQAALCRWMLPADQRQR
jgi:DNA transformation protein and related proteins